jgi:hypothetical protein
VTSLFSIDFSPHGLTTGLAVVAVLGSILIWSGGNDARVAASTAADKRPVKVVITGTDVYFGAILCSSPFVCPPAPILSTL